MKKRDGRRDGPGRGFLLQSGALSLTFHFLLLAALTLSLRYSFPAGLRPGIYRVSIMPISSPGGAAGHQTPVAPSNVLTQPQPTAPTSEKGKGNDPVKEATPAREKKKTPNDRMSQPSAKTESLKSKKEQSIEGLKPSREKKEKEEPFSSGNLQQALEEIRRQAAIDKIRNRVDRRGQTPTGTSPSTSGGVPSAGATSPGTTSQGQTTSPATGPGGPGVGPGATGGPTSIFGLASGSILDARINEYYATIWANIKKEWTIPGNVITQKEGLEAIIVLVIDRQGKLQKTWFEKKSGNNLYDKMAIRAINKAEPLPPLPKEWREDVIELAIRFLPD